MSIRNPFSRGVAPVILRAFKVGDGLRVEGDTLHAVPGQSPYGSGNSTGTNSGDQIAATVPFDNATSGLVATDVQVALDELDATVDVLVAGGGDVVGPGAATDNAITRYDGITGKLLQNSGATLDDSGNLTANNFSGTHSGASSGTNTGDQTLYTDENAQDAVAAMADADDFTYRDAAPLFSARRACQINVTDPAGSALTVGDGQGTPFLVDDIWDGRNLAEVWAAVVGAQSSSGVVTVQIRRVRAGVSADMLSTAVTVNANKTSSFAAGTTPAVIDGTNDDMALEDLIYWDVDGAGTGAKGLVIGLVGEKP